MSAIIRKPLRNAPTPPRGPAAACSARAVVAAVALVASLFGPCALFAAGASSVVVDSSSATNPVNAPARSLTSAANATLGCGPEELARRDQDGRMPTVAELLNPASRTWAEAPALALRHSRPRLLLAEGVIAYAGSGTAAAAARADGTILLFGPECGPAPRVLNMPEGHPAFALGLSGDGSVLAAWSQGTGEFVFFDQGNGQGNSSALGRAGGAGMSLRTIAPLSGGAMLALSVDGQILAAHDGAGAVWAGLRGGEMRPLGQVRGIPILFGFSAGGGVLVSVEATGVGHIWNPRAGKALRNFSVPGGPFARAEFASAPGLQAEPGQQLRLWTDDGREVRWDLLRGEPVRNIEADGAVPGGGSGSLQQRGQALFHVGQNRVWTAAPDYEPMPLALSWSEREHCLRLQDLDGAVRYYSAQTGAPASQCFAVDWRPVNIRRDGSARVPGLALRLFDVLNPAQNGSQVNARAISASSVRLWQTPLEQPSGASPKQNSASIAVSQIIADGQGLSIPLREGLADEPPERFLRLGR